MPDPPASRYRCIGKAAYRHDEQSGVERDAAVRGHPGHPYGELTKNGHNDIVFDNIWGESLNSFYAFGAYPDENGYANNSVIAQHQAGNWNMFNTSTLYGIVEKLYKNNSDNRIYLQVICGRNFTDSTHIYEYVNSEYQKLYGNIWTKGLQADISLINSVVYFIIGNEIAKRKDNQFQTFLQVNNPNFYQRIWGRNSKDIFLLMTDGLAHYNGSDIVPVANFLIHAPERTQPSTRGRRTKPPPEGQTRAGTAA